MRKHVQCLCTDVFDCEMYISYARMGKQSLKLQRTQVGTVYTPVLIVYLQFCFSEINFMGSATLYGTSRSLK
jgi:hypothetical protein